MINRFFDTLDRWREYPNYQLERRADIFFAVHLEKIFSSILNASVADIVPELPIRIGTIYPDILTNKSYKADYVVFTPDNRALLVELKTDDGSTRESQYRYYYRAIEVGFQKIMQGILTIFDKTEYKHKYFTLIRTLTENGSLQQKDGEYSATNKYTFYKNPIFIKPNRQSGDEGEVIEFSQIIDCLQTDQDLLTKRFVESLIKWKKAV